MNDENTISLISRKPVLICPDGDICLNADAFWSFAASVYDSLRDTLLRSQDAHGCDINVILLFLWLDRHGYCLAEPDYRRLIALSREWQASSLEPLRARRRALKGTWGYNTAKDVELDAERSAQAAYLSAVQTPLRCGPSVGSQLADYLAHCGAPADTASLLLRSLPTSGGGTVQPDKVK